MILRNRLLLVVGSSAILITGLIFAIASSPHIQEWYRPPVAMLPGLNEVAEMCASLLQQGNRT